MLYFDIRFWVSSIQFNFWVRSTESALLSQLNSIQFESTHLNYPIPLQDLKYFKPDFGYTVLAFMYRGIFMCSFLAPIHREKGAYSKELFCPKHYHKISLRHHGYTCTIVNFMDWNTWLDLPVFGANLTLQIYLGRTLSRMACISQLNSCSDNDRGFL